MAGRFRRLIDGFLPLGCQKERNAIQTRYRMPLLNWQVLAASQLSGTVFSELDDQRVFQVR